MTLHLRRSLAVVPAVMGALLLQAPAGATPRRAAASQPSSYQLRIVADGLPRPTDVAVRGGQMFVALGREAGERAGSLVRIDLSTGRLTALLQGPDAPSTFALGRDGEVLWTREADGALLSQDRAGAVPRVVRGGIRTLGAVAVDEAQSVYWVEDRRSDRTPDASGIAILDDGRVRLVLSSGARPAAIAVGADGEVLYTNPAEGLLQRVRSDGRNEVLLRGLATPADLALSADGRTVYIVERPTPGVVAEAGGRNRVTAFHLDSRTRTLVARGDPDPTGLAVDEAGRVYWASTSRGQVLEASPVYAGKDLGQTIAALSGNTMYHATLSGDEEAPPVSSPAAGDAKFILKELSPSEDPNRPYLQYAVHARGLAGFTAAHIHVGAPGEAGPVVAPLEAERGRRASDSVVTLTGKIDESDLTGPLAGDWDGFVAALAGGGLYVNLHTETNPGGEIRGQILGEETPENLPPNGTITSPAGDVTIAVGGSVSFAGEADDPNGDAVTVFWDFGDGGTSVELAPGDHVYTSAGTYLVTFTATDSFGLADPTPDTLTVTVEEPAENEPPDGTITAPAGDVTILAGEAVSFAGTATDPDGDLVTVLWDFGDGETSADLTPGDHVYASAGTYLVTFTATDSFGLADPTPGTRTVTVDAVVANEPPDGTITAPATDVAITAGEPVSFEGEATDPNGDAVTVLWDFGDGTTSASLSPGDHVYASAGTYLVTFTATDSFGLADPTPDTRTITVEESAANQPPEGTITSPAGDVTVNAGQAVSFSGTASDPDGDAVTVLWDFGDGSTSDALMPGNHVYADVGVYTVTFTATDSFGLADPTPDTRTVTVNPAEAATATPRRRRP